MQDIEPEDLSEAKKDTVVVTWGRFNPPTTGHQKLIEKVASVAKTVKGDYRIFPTKSVDPKKNPLTFKEKVRFMKKLYPKHAKNISSSEPINTLIKAVAQMSSKGYSNLVLVVGSDRVSEFNKLLNRYNGADFSFDSIKVVSAGDRDPDAKDVTGMSASKMRAAASKGDFKSFQAGVSVKQVAKPLYDAVRKGMKINERFEKDGIFDYAEALNEAVTGSRFNRMLRFGLSDGGTGDIPLTKRAFKDFDSAETNPLLRKKVFSTIDRVFEYLLTDDILYHRFLLLLHRASIFGEGKDNMRFHDLQTTLLEADQTAPLSTAPDHPGRMNFVASFGTPDNAANFIMDIKSTGLVQITWQSGDMREVQFHVIKSSAGQEAPSSDNEFRGAQNRYSGQDTVQFGSEARVVDLVMKHGGKLSRFEGDVREGLDNYEGNKLIEALFRKSERSGVGIDLVTEVYLRGVRDWDTSCDDKDKINSEQWAFNRLNSFLAGGNAAILDEDLSDENDRRDREGFGPLDEVFVAEFMNIGRKLASVAIGAGKTFGNLPAANQRRKAKKADRKALGKEYADREAEKRAPKVNLDVRKEHIDEAFEIASAVDVNEEFEVFVEEHGAGDFGTTKLRNKYFEDTPGQPDPVEEDLAKDVNDANQQRAITLRTNNQKHQKRLNDLRAKDREKKQAAAQRKKSIIATATQREA